MDIKDFTVDLNPANLQQDIYLIGQEKDEPKRTGKFLLSSIRDANPGNSGASIVTSPNPPNNPSIGMVWNEIDGNENLIQQWNWIKLGGVTRWATPKISLHPLTNQSGISNETHYLNLAFDVFCYSYSIYIWYFGTSTNWLSSYQINSYAVKRTSSQSGNYINNSNPITFNTFNTTPVQRKSSNINAFFRLGMVNALPPNDEYIGLEANIISTAPTTVNNSLRIVRNFEISYLRK
jgi:hypothetical protein